MHYDTPENKFDFESKSPDNPFDEDEDDDGKRAKRRLFTLICCDAHHSLLPFFCDR